MTWLDIKAPPSLAAIVVFVLVSGCGGDGGDGASADSGTSWLIPADQVADGGPGQDGIPAIDDPRFKSATTVQVFDPATLVAVVRYNNTVKAYPYDIMNWHEIVNDGNRDDPFSLSYCPLTGSSVAWLGDVGQVRRSFGVSGLLYKSNLILYDRKTESRWSQMLQQAVWGTRAGEFPVTIQVVEMKLSTLIDMYPDAEVMTRDTGWNREYDLYPYGFYRAHEGLLYDVTPLDNRLHLKTRVIGVRTGTESKVYQRDGFGTSTQVVNDQVGNLPIVVVGNSDKDFAAIYGRELSDGTVLSFNAIQDDLPNVMTDTEGNVWDVFGAAVSGPRAGAQLTRTESYTAFWFAWAAFFPDPDIHFN